MSVAYQCQLPGRRGLTLRLGEHRLSIGHDGMVSVPEDQQDWFRAQPGVWSAVGKTAMPSVTNVTDVPLVAPVTPVTPELPPTEDQEVDPAASATAVDSPKRRGRPRKKA